MHWSAEFLDEPVPSRPRRATDAYDIPKGSVPKLKAPLALPSIWDDDEQTEFTDISSIIDKLPPDARAAMHRWKKVRRERISTNRRQAAKPPPKTNGTLPLERIAQPKPLTPAAAASVRRRALPVWPLLAVALVIGMLLLVLAGR